jgi:hypothetical protein
MKKIAQFFILFLISMLSCSKSTIVTKNAPNNPNITKTSASTLLFHSNFEGTSKVIPDTTRPEIIGLYTGVDNTLGFPNNWDTDIKSRFGSLYLFYEGGTDADRSAKIIAEPGNPNNHVLKYTIVNAKALNDTKGRVQTQFITEGFSGIKGYTQSVRIFFPPSFGNLKNFPQKIGASQWVNQVDWFSLFEIWDSNKSEANTKFRATLAIDKEAGNNEELYFSLQGDDNNPTGVRFNTKWFEANTKIPIPINQWFTLFLDYTEGLGANGSMKMWIQIDGGKKQVLFNIQNNTCHSNDTKLDGFEDVSVMKFYCSKNIVNYMKNLNAPLEVYWDNLSFSQK